MHGTCMCAQSRLRWTEPLARSSGCERARSLALVAQPELTLRGVEHEPHPMREVQGTTRVSR